MFSLDLTINTVTTNIPNKLRAAKACQRKQTIANFRQALTLVNPNVSIHTKVYVS